VNLLESLRESASTQMTALLLVAAALLGIVLYLLFRGRQSPAEKEKRRRLIVNQEGRIGDATITEVHENIVFYEYSVRGVQYTASQDISQLREHIPTDPDRLIGSVGLKYSTANPANSIIICEQWSGLRVGSPARTLESNEA
jgi:hypothetical protein